MPDTCALILVRAVAAAALATGDDPRQAVRAALALHAYETAFWDTLADGLD
jgi:hypothetical protein